MPRPSIPQPLSDEGQRERKTAERRLGPLLEWVESLDKLFRLRPPPP